MGQRKEVEQILPCFSVCSLRTVAGAICKDDFGEVPVPQSLCFSEAGMWSCAGPGSSRAPAALAVGAVLSQPLKYLLEYLYL